MNISTDYLGLPVAPSILNPHTFICSETKSSVISSIFLIKKLLKPSENNMFILWI